MIRRILDEAMTAPEALRDLRVAPRILVVDDDLSTRRLLNSSLHQAGYEIHEASDGIEAQASLSAHSYDLVLSDIRMPGMDGLKLLQTIRSRYSETGVVMLTACDEVALAIQAMQEGALDYIVKSDSPQDILERIRRALSRHQEEFKQKQYVRRIEATLKEQTQELQQAFAHLDDASEGTLEALVTALDAREHETPAHSKRVGKYAIHLARVMRIDSDFRLHIGRGAMLHDIGKIGIPDDILLEPEKLWEEKWVEMRKHPQIGYWILQGIPSLKLAAEIVLAHHEHYDGSGYPRGLKGQLIPLGARIFSVVDCLDAMISDRPYRSAASYEVARNEIIRCSGSQFDPEVVKYFMTVPAVAWKRIRQKTLKDQKKLF